ncbi:MAG TPA: MFS transporter [Blastocatellia bacterium]|nr:MFS transporter [Blastocatellia bacterium]
MFFLPLNLIQVQGYSATAAGAALLPFILLFSFLSRWAGGLVEQWGPKKPLILGPLIVGLAFVLLALPGKGGSYWTTFFPGIVLLGLGMATSVAPLTTVVMTSLSADRAGAASGANNAVARVAALLAIGAFGVVMLQAFNSAIDRRLDGMRLPPEARRQLDNDRAKLAATEAPPMLDLKTAASVRRTIADSFIVGFRWVLTLAAALAVLGALIVWLVIEDRPPGRSGETSAIV